MKHVLVLVGPSGVGKRKIGEVLMRMFPTRVVQVSVSRSRFVAERSEAEHHAGWITGLSTAEIRMLPPAFCVSGATRDRQVALDLRQVESGLVDRDTAVVILPYVLVPKLQALPRSATLADGQECRYHFVFVSPFSAQEVARCKVPRALETLLEARMIHRFLVEDTALELTNGVYTDIFSRAREGLATYDVQPQCDRMVVLHDGPSNPNWNSNPPTGNAGEVFREITKLLEL